MKRASANMWWIIIGAVIALVVMIVLLFMFTGKSSDLSTGLSDCEGKGGICSGDLDCPQSTIKTSTFNCGEGDCCLGIAKECDEGDDDPKNCDCGNEKYPNGKRYCQ
ncbi:MAG: hypothetical protein KJ771_01800 [Nanoarchaeota archaeon]|nr:hypothetical protein [Nanoarchaeota archaeon]